MATKYQIDAARLEVQKWEHINRKYSQSGNEPPPFAVQKLSEVRARYEALINPPPKQPRLL